MESGCNNFAKGSDQVRREIDNYAIRINWTESRGNSKQCQTNNQVYPDDFKVRSKVCIDSTTSDEYRYIIRYSPTSAVCAHAGASPPNAPLSNGVANHGITNNENGNAMCEIPWFIQIPKDGQYMNNSISQVQQMGILGMAVNGVPM